MSVTAAATLTRRDLVQVSDLDPEIEFVISGSVTGDATGGTSLLTATFPAGFAIMPITFGSFLADSSAVHDFRWDVNGGGDVLTVSGQAGRLIDGIFFSEEFSPKNCYLIDRDDVVVQVFTNNVDTKVHQIRGFAYGWSLQFARNLPKKFFWPGTMG